MAVPIVAAIGGVLINIVGTVVGRVLIALGIGVATYKGLQITLDQFKSIIESNLGSLGPEIIGMLATMRVGECISMVISAIGVRLLISGLGSGTFKRFIHK